VTPLCSFFENRFNTGFVRATLALYTRCGIDQLLMLPIGGNQFTPDKSEVHVDLLYQVDADRFVQFLDVRSKVLLHLHLPVRARCTVREVCHIVAALYGYCPDERVALRVNGNVFDDTDSPLPEEYICEVVIEPELPLWVCFELEALHMAAPLPLTFSFSEDAKFSHAAFLFGKMMHIPVHFVKFWSDMEPIIPHENSLANYRYVEVYVKFVSSHVVLHYHNSDCGLKLKPVRFSEFPSFAICSSAIRRKFNVSDEWEFQLIFDGTSIGHNINLAFLESSGEKLIDVVPGRLVDYDICERQDLIWTHPSWTVEDLVAKVSSWPKSELRNPDKLDEVLLTNRNLSEFWGKNCDSFTERIIIFTWFSLDGRKSQIFRCLIASLIPSWLCFHGFEVNFQSFLLIKSAYVLTRLSDENGATSTLHARTFLVTGEKKYFIKIVLPDGEWCGEFTACQIFGDVRRVLKEAAVILNKRF
jgi:hypothetical protein